MVCVTVRHAVVLASVDDVNIRYFAVSESIATMRNVVEFRDVSDCNTIVPAVIEQVVRQSQLGIPSDIEETCSPIPGIGGTRASGFKHAMADDIA